MKLQKRRRRRTGGLQIASPCSDHSAYMLPFLPLGFAQNFTPVLRVVKKLGERPGEDTGYPPYIWAKYKFRWAPPLLPRVLGIHFINKPYPTLLKDLNPPLKSLPSKKASKLISTQQLKITLIWTGSKKVHVRHFVRYLNTLMSENGDMMANGQ